MLGSSISEGLDRIPRDDLATTKAMKSEASGLPKGHPIIQKQQPAAFGELPISELWNQAYEDLRKTDAKLIAKYESYLSLSVTTMVGNTVLFSGLGKVQRQQQMEALLRLKIQKDEDAKWAIKLGDDPIAIRDMAEPVLGIIDWAQDFVGNVLNSSPYGSIAWAGVCLLLPVSAAPTFQSSRYIIRHDSASKFNYLVKQDNY